MSTPTNSFKDLKLGQVGSYLSKLQLKPLAQNFIVNYQARYFKTGSAAPVFHFMGLCFGLGLLVELKHRGMIASTYISVHFTRAQQTKRIPLIIVCDEHQYKRLIPILGLWLCVWVYYYMIRIHRYTSEWKARRYIPPASRADNQAPVVHISLLRCFHQSYKH